LFGGGRRFWKEGLLRGHQLEKRKTGMLQVQEGKGSQRAFAN